jgi:hypothetical protein
MDDVDAALERIRSSMLETEDPPEQGRHDPGVSDPVTGEG